MIQERSPLWAMSLRAIGLLAAFLALAIAASEIEDAALSPAEPAMGPLALATLAALGVALAAVLVIRVVRPRHAADGWAGFPQRPGTLAAYLAGWLAGGVSLAFAAGIGLLLGTWDVSHVLPVDATTLMVVLFGLVAAGAGAFLEEAIFRGALFSEFRSRLPTWAALILIALPFAGLHALNDGFGAGFMIAAVLASVFFGVLRLWLGDLWFATGWHSAWNFVQYAVIGIATVDAAHRGHALIQVDRAGPAWMTGTGQSVEGGLLAGGMIGLWLIAALLLLRRRPTS